MRLIETRGWGFWAVEERASNQFIGFVGLHVPSDDLPFSPCVEIGWRLAKHDWGLVMPRRPHNEPSHSPFSSFA